MARLVVKGNVAKLKTMAKQLRRPEPALKAMALNMAEESLNLVDAGFDSGTDPYGKAWDAPNNLQITGRMRAYAYSGVSERGFTVHATDKKAIWHHAPGKRQAGTSWNVKAHEQTVKLKRGRRVRRVKVQIPAHTASWRRTWRLPTRLQVPTKGRGLPSRWKKRYQALAKEALEDWLHG